MDGTNDVHLPFERCEGLRRGSVLIYIPEIKHIYKIKSKSEKSLRYVCYNKKCPASVVVATNSKILARIPKHSAAHNHPTQEALRAKLRIISELKTECANAPRKRSSIRDVFNRVCAQDNESASSIDFKRISRQLLNIQKKSSLVPLQKNLMDYESYYVPQQDNRIDDDSFVPQQENVMHYDSSVVKQENVTQYDSFGLTQKIKSEPMQIETVTINNICYTIVSTSSHETDEMNPDYRCS